ncbi:MAG: putative lipid II flippase FtsW [Acidimicrobiales bacterium]
MTRLEHRVLVSAVFGLCLLGLPIVLSASAVTALQAGASVYSLFVKQAMFLGIGCVAALIASRVPAEVLRRFRFVLPLGALVLLIAVFMPGIGHNAGGSSRWIGAGPIQIQPSELMKLGVIIFAADLLARRASRPDPWRAVVLPLLQLVAFAGILIMKQPDLGTCIVIVCIAFALMFSAGLPVRIVAGSFMLLAVPGAALALDASYRRARLLSFLDPFAHASSTGYQVVQSLVTLGQGGLRGNGVGGSITTWGYLPNGHTDFIFAVIGGNLGLLGTIGVIIGFAAFAWAGFRVAQREKDPFTRYVAIGVTCWIVAQAVINIGGVVDALPVTGIPLPFISYGGSALVLALTGAGILVGIARRQLPTVATAVQPARAADGQRRPRPGAARGIRRSTRPVVSGMS